MKTALIFILLLLPMLGRSQGTTTHPPVEPPSVVQDPKEDQETKSPKPNTHRAIPNVPLPEFLANTSKAIFIQSLRCGGLVAPGLVGNDFVQQLKTLMIVGINPCSEENPIWLQQFSSCFYSPEINDRFKRLHDRQQEMKAYLEKRELSRKEILEMMRFIGQVARAK